jgi:glycosyltransferase involved in cell wall biosynthesis
VVIPTHNRPDRLAKAIQSVLDQTERDFELFVVDDGSHDQAAADVVRASGDPRVSYIQLPVARGPAAARNAGIAKATAPYVAFLDDDDEWLPEKLAVQVAALERADPGVGLTYSARITVDKIAGTEVITRFPVAFDRASGLNVITLSSVLMKRRCLDSVGVFDEELFGTEDFDLWIRAAESYTFSYVDQPLVRYLIHGEGISHHERQQALSSNVGDRHARSLERLLTKHRQLLHTNRRRHCRSYLTLAAKYGRTGDVMNERRALLHSLRLWPLEPRVYWALIRASLNRSLGTESPPSESTEASGNASG